MFRSRVLGGVTATLLALIFPALAAGVRGQGASLGPAQRAASVEIYYTSPVLARAGELVLMPVQVVCVGPGGRACPASVTLSTRVGREGWRSVSAPATPEVTFDLSAPAARAGARGGSGSVQFVIRARGAGSRAILPPLGESAPLSFFVTTRITVRQIATPPFGRTRPGRTVLALPWGTGPLRAGLSPGRESASLGPGSFDVDPRGRVYLLDPQQGRMAVFSSGRLLRETALSLDADAQVATGSNGAATVVSRAGGELALQAVDRSGAPQRATAVPGTMVDAVRTVGGHTFGLALPLDAWVGLDTASPSEPGMPLSDGGQLLRVARPDGIRLAIRSADGHISDAVELRAAARLGEVALAEPDAQGGCWIVVHLWRELPMAADQYEVLHVVGTRVRASFAVADRAFTDTPPLSRFRIGGDGALYQLMSTATGIRIVRFDLKEER